MREGVPLGWAIVVFAAPKGPSMGYIVSGIFHNFTYACEKERRSELRDYRKRTA